MFEDAESPTGKDTYEIMLSPVRPLGLPEFVQKAVALLHAAHFEAYPAGGCVRDLCMGMPPQDWDITTSAAPADTLRVFADHPCAKTGLKHGTVTVFVDDVAIEVTTFRVEGAYSDNRRPDDVSFVTSLREDLSRRDFTMNAMAYDLCAAEIIDPFGGVADIRAGLIRCVGNPDDRFAQDALRILRGVRFASVLGFRMEEATARSLWQNRARLTNISSERIQTELTKLLCGAHAPDALLAHADVMAAVIPELAPTFGFSQHTRHHCYDVWRHTVAVVGFSPFSAVSRWAALFHDIGKPLCFTQDEHGEGHFYGHSGLGADLADAIMRRLRFDNKTRARVVLLIREHDRTIRADKRAVLRALHRMGPDAFAELLALKMADNQGKAPIHPEREAQLIQLDALFRAVLAEKACFALKDLAVKGDDLLALGYRGADVGAALRHLLRAVMEGGVCNEKQTLLSWLQNGKKEM